jgi:hypothetical protein
MLGRILMQVRESLRLSQDTEQGTVPYREFGIESGEGVGSIVTVRLPLVLF